MGHLSPQFREGSVVSFEMSNKCKIKIQAQYSFLVFVIRTLCHGSLWPDICDQEICVHTFVTKTCGTQLKRDVCSNNLKWLNKHILGRNIYGLVTFSNLSFLV